MSEDDEIKNVALRVENVMPQLAEHLFARTEEVFSRKRRGSSPEMFSFGRICDGVPSAEFYQDFADRLNKLVSSLDGKTEYDDGSCPCVDAVLGVPMLIPLAGERSAVIVFMFVYDLPFWRLEYDDVTFKAKAAIEWLCDHIGHIFVVTREGELPINSEDR